MSKRDDCLTEIIIKKKNLGSLEVSIIWQTGRNFSFRAKRETTNTRISEAAFIYLISMLDKKLICKNRLIVKWRAISRQNINDALIIDTRLKQRKKIKRKISLIDQRTIFPSIERWVWSIPDFNSDCTKGDKLIQKIHQRRLHLQKRIVISSLRISTKKKNALIYGE